MTEEPKKEVRLLITMRRNFLFLVAMSISALILCAALVFTTNATSRFSKRIFAFRRTYSSSSHLLVSNEANCDSVVYFSHVTEAVCSKTLSAADWRLLTQQEHRGLLDFRRVVLIVSFNEPHFKAMPKVHRLYHDLFLKVVYCVTGMHNLASYMNGTYLPLVNESVVELTQQPTSPTGQSFYICIPRVLDTLSEVRQWVLENRTDGFLHISDDLIANLWNYKLRELDLSKNWLLGPAQALYDFDRRTFCDGKDSNNTKDCTRPEVWSVLRQYQKQLNKTFNEAEANYPKFIEKLANASTGERRVWNIYADLFYVSNRHLAAASEMFRLFGKHEVYMELAVGTVLKGITEPSQLQFLRRAGQVYGPSRTLEVTKTYSATTHIYHPLKLGSIHNSTVDRECLYCAIVKAFDKMREAISHDPF